MSDNESFDKLDADETCTHGDLVEQLKQLVEEWAMRTAREANVGKLVLSTLKLTFADVGYDAHGNIVGDVEVDETNHRSNIAGVVDLEKKT